MEYSICSNAALIDTSEISCQDPVTHLDMSFQSRVRNGSMSAKLLYFPEANFMFKFLIPPLRTFITLTSRGYGSHVYPPEIISEDGSTESTPFLTLTYQ